MRAALIGLIVTVVASAAAAEVLYSPEGNRLRRYDIDSIKAGPLRQDILIERAAIGGERGRDINGMVCAFPDASGRFIAGEDTGQPVVPPGWGVFEADGTQIGKLTATYFVDPGDPFGCAFDSQGRLFTTEIGSDIVGPGNGQLIIWFPPFDRFPGEPAPYPNSERSTGYCKIASNLGTVTSIAIDELDRVYVTSARAGANTAGGSVVRFDPPFPTGPDAAGGCGLVDSLGSPLASASSASVFIADSNVPTPTGIARALNGNWYVASVINGVIGEFDASGAFVRRVLSPPRPGLPASTGNPQGIAVDAAGDLFFADLQLTAGPGGVGPGPNGKVRWLPFDEAGTPLPPVIIREQLAFPDAVAVLPGSIEGCGDDCGPTCAGDCDGDGAIGVAELITGVGIVLGTQPLSACETLDGNEDGAVGVNELVAAVDGLLNGCGSD